MRVDEPDRQLQGPRRQRDAVAAARAGDHACAGGQLRQRRRGGRRLCGGRRDAGDDHDPGLHQSRQDGADAGVWRGDPADPRQPPGHRRRRGARGGVDLLRQPQLASVLPAGHQDAGLRTVGGPGLPRAGQHHHAVRRRLERTGLRDRLFRIAAGRRDHATAADFRRPAGELRPDRRGVPGRHRRRGRDADRTDHRRGHRDRQTASAGARSSPRCATAAAARSLVSEAEHRVRRCSTSRATGVYVEPTSAQVVAGLATVAGGRGRSGRTKRPCW